MKVFPESRLGKWSVGLTALFVLLLATFFTSMLFGLVTFDVGHWWDATVGISVLVEIIAFVLSILAMRKPNGLTVLVCTSAVIGNLVVLFILLHSLFIND